MSANPIVWWELATHDAEKTVKFFREVFDWQIDFDGKVGFFKMRHNPPNCGRTPKRDWPSPLLCHGDLVPA